MEGGFGDRVGGPQEAGALAAWDGQAVAAIETGGGRAAANLAFGLDGALGNGRARSGYAGDGMARATPAAAGG